eukprot:gb/GFBE01064548.1/.p3 GENE.gb/GFBE01064548.1/~~gb/GFBE01064548.1/.p3  ORF type:complete len:131 (-),score=28.40 gb/GFBE01064548.1/:19-411(-)
MSVHGPKAWHLMAAGSSRLMASGSSRFMAGGSSRFMASGSSRFMAGGSSGKTLPGSPLNQANLHYSYFVKSGSHGRDVPDNLGIIAQLKITSTKISSGLAKWHGVSSRSNKVKPGCSTARVDRRVFAGAN